MKVAIQGIKGSYHHQVAIEFFSDDIEIDECMSFDALIESMIEDKSDFGVMIINGLEIGYLSTSLVKFQMDSMIFLILEILYI